MSESAPIGASAARWPINLSGLEVPAECQVVRWHFRVIHEPEPAGALASLAVGARADERPGEDGSAGNSPPPFCAISSSSASSGWVSAGTGRPPINMYSFNPSTVPPVALARCRAGVCKSQACLRSERQAGLEQDQTLGFRAPSRSKLGLVCQQARRGVNCPGASEGGPFSLPRRGACGHANLPPRNAILPWGSLFNPLQLCAPDAYSRLVDRRDDFVNPSSGAVGVTCRPIQNIVSPRRYAASSLPAGRRRSKAARPSNSSQTDGRGSPPTSKG